VVCRRAGRVERRFFGRRVVSCMNRPEETTLVIAIGFAEVRPFSFSSC
jgi:hypothetical protein